jgi:endoglucanase
LASLPPLGRIARIHRLISAAVAFAVLLGFALTARGDHPVASHRPPASRPPAPPPHLSPCAADPARLPTPRSANGQPLDYWHTCGTQIVDHTGQPIHIAGIAWSGMELPGGAPQGLDRRNYAAVLYDVKMLGYNVVRIPFSSESIRPGHMPSGINYQANPDLRGLTSLQVLDRIIAECHQLGLKVILDHHRISPWSVPTLWYDSSYSEDQWVADWQRLAERYKGNDTVVAFDLQNEPYEATWGSGDPRDDWRRAATRAGNAILRVNPYALIFVQGVGSYNGVTYWYGGELQGVAAAPIHLVVPDRLVYSPHEYGPSVYKQAWFSTPDYPSNLPAIWNKHWGFIVQSGIAPVVVGETGAPETGYDVGGTWQRVFLSFLNRYHVGFIAWALNPTSSDTGGVFESDWSTVNTARQDLYAPYLRR